MQKVLLHILFSFLGLSLMAQNPVVTITNPSDLTEPYEVCMGTVIDLEADTSGVTNWMYDKGWYYCTEMPDFDGKSNEILWQNYYDWANPYVYQTTVNEEMYIWFTSVVPGGWIGEDLYSNVIHIQMKGDIPSVVYTDSVFCEGSSMTITSSIDNLGDGKYQWYKDGMEIVGATNFSLDITEPGSYHVAALTNETDCPGAYYPGEPVEFAFVKPNLSGTFTPDLYRVTMETESTYDSYQWYNGATPLTGETTNTYNATVTSSDEFYHVEVTYYGCTAYSDTLLINDVLYSKPEIIEPASDFACRADIISLELTNSSYTSYQWYKNGTAIWNATNSTFDVGSGYPGGPGVYTVGVTTEIDPENEILSNEITIDFALQPYVGVKDNATLCPGEQVTLEAKTGYSSPVGGFDTYQWYVNDVNDFSTAISVPGATDSVLVIDVPSEARYYWVSTTLNSCDDVSNTKTINEFSLSAPYLGKTPYDGEICEGDSVTIRTYTNDVTYQWYYNGEAIEGATEQEYKAGDVGYYDLEISSTICQNADPVMNNDSVVVAYKAKPTFFVDPAGEEYNGPNHVIFCTGDTVSLALNNASNYSSIQWVGKLFPLYSTLDAWEDIEGETDSAFTFINGVTSAKLHYRVRVDSIMANDEVCTAYSEYKTIDAWVFQSPTVTSYNTELCEEGDSALIHNTFPGEWERFEWYLDGELIPDSNTDTIYGKETGMYVITAYPEKCPTIPHSSGIGPTVTMMGNAEIIENDTVIFAQPLPQFHAYNYQWFVDGDSISSDTLEYPSFIYKDQLVSGVYTVEVSNNYGCLRISDAFEWNLVTGTQELSMESIRFYPNPVSEILNIELPEDFNNGEYVEIYNMTGVLVKHVELNGSFVTVDMNEMNPGIYLVKVQGSNQQSLVTRVVKN